MQKLQKGFSLIAIITAIAAFFTGAVHVTPIELSAPTVDSTSTAVEATLYDATTSNTIIPDDKPSAKLIEKNYLPSADNSPFTNKSITQVTIPTNISTSSTNMETPVPVITSITPPVARIGDTIAVIGKNIKGFEGDKSLWIENMDLGMKGVVYGDAGTIDEIIMFTLKDKYCIQDNSYSGKPCTNWLNIVPGEYVIYTSPWGKDSNIVNFIVANSSLTPVKNQNPDENKQIHLVESSKPIVNTSASDPKLPPYVIPSTESSNSTAAGADGGGSFWAVSYKFQVSTSNTPVYISTNPNDAVLSVNSIRGNVSLIVDPISLTGDTSAYYFIPSNSSRHFTVSASIYSPRSPLISKFYYGFSPDNLKEGSIFNY